VPADAAAGAELAEVWAGYLAAAERERRAGETRSERDFPHFTEGGSWRLLGIDRRSAWRQDVYDHGNWTAGFWYGVMWLLAAGSGDGRAAGLARSRLPLLATRAGDWTTHDLGFLFFPGFVLGRQAGLLPDHEDGPARQAARTLAGRFNPRGHYLQAFGPVGDPRSAGTSTIDTMMNLPLLWWAAGHGEDPGLLAAARCHARTSARLFVRPDGTTFHLLRFDPVSGAVLDRGTFQGATDTSCWSRGQAWAACGFAWAFAVTGEPELLRAAEVTGACFFERLPPSGIPPWDFSDAAADAPRDASAAAVGALGALILGRVHPDPDARSRWHLTATATLGKLGSACLNLDGTGDGILLRSCYSKPHGLGLDGATAWGDFYLGLALALGVGAVAFEAVVGPAGP